MKSRKLKLEDIVYKNLQDVIIENRYRSYLLSENEPAGSGGLQNLLDFMDNPGGDYRTELLPQDGQQIQYDLENPLVAGIGEFTKNKLLEFFALDWVQDVIKVALFNYFVESMGWDPNSLKCHIIRAVLIELDLADLYVLTGWQPEGEDDGIVRDCEYFSEKVAGVAVNVIGTYVLLPMLGGLAGWVENAVSSKCHGSVFGDDTVSDALDKSGAFGLKGASRFGSLDSDCVRPAITNDKLNSPFYLGSPTSWKDTIKGFGSGAFGAVFVDQISDIFDIDEYVGGYMSDLMCSKDDSGNSVWVGMQASVQNTMESLLSASPDMFKFDILRGLFSPF